MREASTGPTLRPMHGLTETRCIGATAALSLGLLAAPAHPHDVPRHDPAAMPHEVSAGFVALDTGRYAGLLEGGELGGAGGLFAAGARLGYGLMVPRPIQLRLSAGYAKPLIGIDAVDSRLHELRFTLGAHYVAPLVGSLEIDAGVDAGAGLFVLAPPAGGAVTVASGPTASVTLGVRSWISGHVATFADVTAGLSATSGDDPSVMKAWPWRLTIGLLDRF